MSFMDESENTDLETKNDISRKVSNVMWTMFVNSSIILMSRKASYVQRYTYFQYNPIVMHKSFPKIFVYFSLLNIRVLECLLGEQF